MVHNRVGLVDAEGSAGSIEAADARLYTDHIGVGLGNIRVADAPETQKKVQMLLALADFLNSTLIESLITVVRDVMLEKFLLPVVVAICLLKELVVSDIHLLCAFHIGLVVAIVDDGVAAVHHHLTELVGLLCEGAGAIIFARDCVGDGENVEPKFGFRRRSVRRTT